VRAVKIIKPEMIAMAIGCHSVPPARAIGVRPPTVMNMVNRIY
jgi:hypothetical protein